MYGSVGATIFASFIVEKNISICKINLHAFIINTSWDLKPKSGCYVLFVLITAKPYTFYSLEIEER